MDSSLSASSASVNIDDVVGAVDEDIWQGWDYQDNMAIEEVERFDDISVLVFFGCRTGTIEAHCDYGWKH